MGLKYTVISEIGHDGTQEKRNGERFEEAEVGKIERVCMWLTAVVSPQC